MAPANATPWPLACAAALVCPPISHPESTNASRSFRFSNTHTSRNFFTPIPSPAWTSSIFMYVLFFVALFTATPVLEPPPATKIFMAKSLKTAYPAAFATAVLGLRLHLVQPGEGRVRHLIDIRAGLLLRLRIVGPGRERRHSRAEQQEDRGDDSR